MTDAAVFLGYPVEFKDICLIYPPKVKDVAADKNYLFYEKILTISQEEIEDEWTENNIPMDSLLTPLEYLLNHAYHDKDFEAQARAAFMFFIHEPVLFLYEQKVIFIGDAKQLDISRIITEGMYFEFQNAIREACGNKAIEPPNPNENPRIK